MCNCESKDVKLINTLESPWEDMFNIVCANCLKKKLYRVSESEAYNIIKANNYNIIFD